MMISAQKMYIGLINTMVCVSLFFYVFEIKD